MGVENVDAYECFKIEGNFCVNAVTRGRDMVDDQNLNNFFKDRRFDSFFRIRFFLNVARTSHIALLTSSTFLGLIVQLLFAPLPVLG